MALCSLGKLLSAFSVFFTKSREKNITTAVMFVATSLCAKSAQGCRYYGRPGTSMTWRSCAGEVLLYSTQLRTSVGILISAGKPNPLCQELNPSHGISSQVDVRSSIFRPFLTAVFYGDFFFF